MTVARLGARRIVLTLSLLALALAACSSPAERPGAGTPEPGGAALPEATEDVQGLNPDLILDRFGQPTATTAAPQSMSQAEAQAQLPFHYALPAWTPPGFTRQDQVEVVLPSQAATSAYASVIITWLNPDESALRLQVASRPADRPALRGAGSSQATSVNGEPAVLVQSGSASLGQARLSLSWQRNGLSFSLSADPAALTADDLLRMAESIPAG